MRWPRISLVVVGVLAGGIALVAASPRHGDAARPGTQDQSFKNWTVGPQIEVFRQIVGEDGAELGVRLRDLDEAMAKDLKLPGPSGAVVESVRPGSAAEKAGIKAGDVITAFDGERVRSVLQLRRLVSDTPAGRRVAVTVVRDGAKIELTAAPEERKGAILEGDDKAPLRERRAPLADLRRRQFRFEWPDEMTGPGIREYFGAGGRRLGLGVQALTPQLGEYFGVKEGALVTSVEKDMPAAAAGVKAGDVVTTVDGKSVADADALVRAVRAHEGDKPLSLGIVRDRKPMTLSVKLTGAEAAPARPI